MSKTLSSAEAARKEEEDLAKAIQLSLKETSSTNAVKQPSSSSSSSLFGSLPNNLPSNNVNQRNSHDRKQVKALYDFEAAEDNEITFKAGEILQVIDSSDQNWWKGSNSKGDEGLFPSNFVTSDLSVPIETFDTKNKKVSFNENVNVKLLENQANNDGIKTTVIIDEKKIDDCIDQLQNADPTGEIQPDSKEMLDLEDNCYSMGPLIDQQLQQIDSKHAILEDLNMKILEAFQMYNNLMKESITKTTGFLNQQPLGLGGAVNQQATPNQMPLNQQPFNQPLGYNQASSFQMPANNQAIPYVASGPSTGATTAAYPNNYNSNAAAYMLANQLNNFAIGSPNNNNVNTTQQQQSLMPPSSAQNAPNNTYPQPQQQML